MAASSDTSGPPSIKPWWRRSGEYLQSVLIPDFRAPEYLYAERLGEFAVRSERWLDAGCGRAVVPEWMGQCETQILGQARRAVGMDICLENLASNSSLRAKVGGILEACPFRDESFDLVTARFVLEHVEDTDAAMREVHRILTPRGVFLFHTPNRCNYQVMIASVLPQRVKNKVIAFLEGRLEIDIFRTYYGLNTPRRVRKSARKHGFLLRHLVLADSAPVTLALGPFAVVELLIMRLLRCRRFAGLRSTMIAVLEKAPVSEGPSHPGFKPDDESPCQLTAIGRRT